MVLASCACGAAVCPATADVRQLFVCTYFAAPHENNNKVFRIPLEGPDADTLIQFAGPEDGIASPSTMAVHPETGRLYVGNLDTHQLLEFEINADGSKGASRVYGTFVYYEGAQKYYPDFFSMAVRPSTGRIYIGCFYGGMRGIFVMNEGNAGAEMLVPDRPYPEPSYFYDECWICFDPVDDRIIYAGTGFENHIRMFDADDGSDLGYLHGYDDNAYKYGPPEVSGHFLPHQFFVPGEGGGYDLLACTYISPGGGPRRLIKLDPYEDTYVEELPAGGPSLGLSMSIFDFVRDNMTGKLYAGGFYCELWKIDRDYRSVEMISTRYNLPREGQSRVAISYGHSAGTDIDRDGLTDDDEVSLGTDPYNADSDDDGLVDYDEVYYDGNGAYNPYDPLTNPEGTDTDVRKADTDGDGFSDLLEIAAGSNPIKSGWTAGPFQAKISFAPSGSPRISGFSMDTGWSYTEGRNYGWR